MMKKKLSVFFSDPIKIGYFFVFLTIFIRSLNPILFKSAALQLSSFTFITIFTNVFYIINLFLFFVRAITWQLALKHLPLSVAYPFMSLSYVVIMITGYFGFQEEIRWNHLLGTGLIVMGSILIGKKDE